MHERYVVSKQHAREWWIWDRENSVRVDWFERRPVAEARARILNRCPGCGQPVLSDDTRTECREA